MGLAAVILTFTANASVACSDGVLFSCSIGQNQLAVCLNDDAATYSFGPRGQPELELTEPFARLDYHPWVGMGRWEQNSVSFTNGDYEYRVSAARDRLDDEQQELWDVGVAVSRDGERLALLTCEKTFHFNVLEELWSSKLQAGLCWSRTEWTWKASEDCGYGECAC